jgi:hypothetical protein
MRLSKHSVVERDMPPEKEKEEESEMAMNRKVTRDVYEAREIVQEPEPSAVKRDKNQEALDEAQKKMRPIRSSQRTFVTGE